MTWASPWAFLLLVPVWLTVLAPWLMGRNRLAVASLAAVRVGWSLRLLFSWLPGFLRPLSLTLIVFALARPQELRRDVVVESEGLDIMIAIDTSGSMEAEDFSVGGRSVNRLQVAKGVTDEFVQGRPYDRIGIVEFGEEAFTQVPLTRDHDSLRSVLADMRIGGAGPRGTAIGTAIAVSAKRLKDLDAPDKVLVLLTDGRNNAGRLSPQDAAVAAGAVGITVYTIGVGAKERGFFGAMREEIDEPTLRRIAEATGGEYFRATDTRSLREIFARIDELEPSPAEVDEVVDAIEHYRRYLVPGLALYLVQMLLSLTWLRRGP